jgi:transposase
LEQLYRTEANGRLKERLLAILHLYEGRRVKEVSALVKRCENTVREWRSRWNAEGYQGLKLELTGGPKPQLSEEQWDEVADNVKGKGMSIEDARQYVLQQYHVEYGYHMVWRELREKRKLSYGKPFMVNEKMPAEAQEQLKKR